MNENEEIASLTDNELDAILFAAEITDRPPPPPEPKKTVPKKKKKKKPAAQLPAVAKEKNQDPVDMEKILREMAAKETAPKFFAEKILSWGNDGIDLAIKRMADFSLRSSLRTALPLIGAAAVPRLVYHLSNKVAVYDIREILREIGPQAGPLLLEQLSSSRDPRILEFLIELIGSVKPQGAEEKLHPFLENPDYKVRFKTETALRSLGVDPVQIKKQSPPSPNG